MGKILLVTSHPLSDADAASLVAEFGGAGTDYHILVPARIHDTSGPTLMSANQSPTDDGRFGVEAEAIAGSATDALHAAGAIASGTSVSDHDLVETISERAIAAGADRVVIMTGHASGIGHLLKADLAAQVQHHLSAAGSPIDTVREHRHR
jgi:nucleotide-binding universal stress UspA family protein